MSKSKIALFLKIVGAFFLEAPFALMLLGYVLSILFWCNGVIDSVNCSLNVSFIEKTIGVLFSAGWYSLLTTWPSLVILAVGFALSDKKPTIFSGEQTTETTKISKYHRVVDKVIKWTLIILVVLFLFSSAVNMLSVLFSQ